jgi:hypothetical protein
MAHARFETLLLIPDELAERRRRLMVGALAAAAVSLGVGVLGVAAERLGISRVDPPKTMVSIALHVLEPPPPPSPPPPVSSAVETSATDDAAPDEDRPLEPEPDLAPAEVLPLDLDARPKARTAVPGVGGRPGVPGGVPGIPGVPGGKPGCLVPPCVGTQPIDRPMVPQPRTSGDPVQAPIKAVMATARFTPDPDQARLGRTPTGRGQRKPGSTTVAFCIDGSSGKTYDVRTRRGFPGDAEVDEICRSTVARWRFSPQRVGDKPRSTCTSVTFDIRFD